MAAKNSAVFTALLVLGICQFSSAATIDGTIVRSFASPLGVWTYGIGMDNDGTHAWISKRTGTGQFTQIDLFGNEVPGTRVNRAVSIPQGFEMDAGGQLWLVDRSSNSENAVQMTTAGGTTSTIPIGFLNNHSEQKVRSFFQFLH